MSRRTWWMMVFVFAGCGGPTDYHVSGSVTFQGKPLPAGQVFFEPDYMKGNDGPASMAMVKDGQYDTRNLGRGVIGGAYNIRIECFDGKPGNELPLGKPLATIKVSRDLPKADSKQDFDLKP